MQAFLITILLASLTGAAPASAAPQSASVTKPKQSASIGFDPPEEPVRYRWEKTDQRSNATRSYWTISTFEFEPRGDGYRLTVTPKDSGSNETDPERAAFAAKFAALGSKPFNLKLSESGQIEEFEGLDQYWTEVIATLKAALPASGAKDKDAAAMVAGLFGNMSSEAQLALLTESIQPMLEFADTESTVDEPIQASVDTPAPWGGTLKRDITITLTKVTDTEAYLALRSSIPRAELEKVMNGMLKQLGPGVTDSDQKKASAFFAGVKDFRHDTRADYRVDLESGLLQDFHSVETVVLGDSSKQEKRVITRGLKRIDY